MSEQPIDRTTLSFKQAEGLIPLPSQLRPREVSSELRAVLYAVLLASYQRDKYVGGGRIKISGRWRPILERWHIFVLHLPADEFNDKFDFQVGELKSLLFTGNYADIFHFLTFVVRDASAPPQLAEQIQQALTYARAGYRLLEKTFVPVASQDEADTLERAFADVSNDEFAGARAHLREAGVAASAGNWAASIRESIHAVEAVARSIAPDSDTLGPALKALKASHHIHPALADGLSKIYGFTNDEQGIRHPLLEEEFSKVDEVDALYMLGACAAFVSYLIARRPQAANV